MHKQRLLISCDGKRLYADLPTANKMAKRTNDDRDAHVSPYHCTRCHGWHVGTANKKPRRKPVQTELSCQD